MLKKSIVIGCDHAGLDLKNKLIAFLNEIGYEVKDIGTYTKDSCHYPQIAKNLVMEILNKNFEQGILVCGTGIGMSMMANRFNGVRAAVVSDTCSAKMSKSHNNSNVLCLGERILGEELAKDIVKIWLETEFVGGRHSQRIAMFDED